MTQHAPTLALFNHGFDRVAHDRLSTAWPVVSAGFDLFRFPSQARLAWLDLDRFAALQAVRARAQGLQAVVSHEDQFGAVAAALVAERLGLPGTPVRAVLACQHKLHARRVLQAVCPQANVPFQAFHGGRSIERWSCRGAPLAAAPGAWPLFAKPIKAAFSILAREVPSAGEWQRLTRFGWWESRLLKMLVGPFDRVCARRLPEAGSALGMLLEAPVHAPQFNLDGYVHQGRVVPLGVVDAVMYPGTQAFMRFDYPSRLPSEGVRQAVAVAEAFLQAVGFDHGTFNMEFFHDPDTGRVTVIEFNPRLASQFSDLYERVAGVNLHEVALALAHGQDPALLARRRPTARVASSFVYRSFDPERLLPRPSPRQLEGLRSSFPDALLMEFPKSGPDARRDHKWLGSCRHGILHLGGQDEHDLRLRCEAASRLLGWLPPYREHHRAGRIQAMVRPIDRSADRKADRAAVVAVSAPLPTHPHNRRNPA